MSEEQYVNLSVCGDQVTEIQEINLELVEEEIIMKSKTDGVAKYEVIVDEDNSYSFEYEFKITYDCSESEENRLFWDNE